MSRALFKWSGGDANQFFYFTWPYITKSLNQDNDTFACENLTSMKVYATKE